MFILFPRAQTNEGGGVLKGAGIYCRCLGGLSI
jgi:hypothetical protein